MMAADQRAHSHESHTAGAGQGPVAVEVGSGVGALLLWTGPEMDGAELDITPVGHEARRRHVAVLPRHLPDRTVHAAVYPLLTPGRYQVWDQHGVPHLEVDVADGEITEAHWHG
ncbi:hypothetical protein ACPPVT_14645 [Angustibacter sp. McL0619]|uniref:hypothetical protein n=1 Tax=Angustibacter sp. McL0619 TaxID=3415676 RepID=UPI003CF8E1DF